MVLPIDGRARCASSAAARSPRYKVPRYIRFVSEMPRTIIGKAQKFAMRQRMIDDLRLSVAKTA
jgi:acyl-coenzyme A synthetase/AMP-(fatty) acid ligase